MTANESENGTSSFTPKHSYEYDELLRSSKGDLFGPENAQLPAPPMLMFDRISEIHDTGGLYDRGWMRAELKVVPTLWFFACHFPGDPVMPGCLGLDALWQMLGFFLAWGKSPGKGRALGVGEVRFTNQVLPDTSLIEYGIDIRRTFRSRLVLGVADGWVRADGDVIYTAKELRVGLYQNLEREPGGSSS